MADIYNLQSGQSGMTVFFCWLFPNDCLFGVRCQHPFLRCGLLSWPVAVEGELAAESELEAVGCPTVEGRDAGDQWGCGLLVMEVVWIPVWCVCVYVCVHISREA